MHTNKSEKEIKEIVLLVAQSDRTAFTLLYDYYWQSVYKTACRYLKSTALAEDLVQEVFMSIWLKRQELIYIKNLDNYFFIVARNKILSALRNKQFRLTIVSQEAAFEIPELACTTDTSKETEILIDKAVARLPPQQKKVFLLTRRNGLSHAEIAEILNINARTVNNHITRALGFIQQFLKEQHRER